MDEAHAPVVKPGQIWEAYEPIPVYKRGKWSTKVSTRTLHVLEIVDRGACGGTEPGARCHVVETGRKVIVALRRMKPGKTRGYRMVADANQ